MRRFILLAFFLTCTSIAFVFAQPSRQKVTQPIEWFSLGSNIKLTKIISVYVEGQFRYAQSFDPMQYQLRTALEVNLGKHFSVVPLGYVYTWNYLYGKQPAVFKNNEHRIWQQVFFKHTWGRVNLDHRLRLEQRFIQKHSIGPADDIVDEGYTNKQIRLRYRFMGKVPLGKSSIDPKTYFLSFYDEVFISWGKTVTYHEPDQNRIFTGLGYAFTKTFNIQTGFLYQMLIKANGHQQENNLGIQVMVNYNFTNNKEK